MEWSTPKKPAELTEERLIQAILDGHFAIDSTLPGERELAVQLGVTRPTLREALQRLARDGWLEIRQGRPTRVRNYWQEGNLTILASIIQYREKMPIELVHNLLHIRLLMAPSYTRLAIENNAQGVAELLNSFTALDDKAEDYSQADWQLHRYLTLQSNNPVFTLILNGFENLYLYMGNYYFSQEETRAASKAYYHSLAQYAAAQDSEEAEKLTQEIMQQSMVYWNELVLKKLSNN
jgi:GntR family negative regulator for fad regulon and positive regulator of fabA